MTEVELKYILDGYDNGVISREVAEKMLLHSSQLPLLDNSNSSENKIEEVKLLTRDELCNKIVEEIMYGDGDTRGLHLTEILNYMKSINWKWAHYDIDEAGFKKLFSMLLKECLHEVLDNNEEEYSTASGGIQVTCYINDDDDLLCTELEFIADTGYHAISLERISSNV